MKKGLKYYYPEDKDFLTVEELKDELSQNHILAGTVKISFICSSCNKESKIQYRHFSFDRMLCLECNKNRIVQERKESGFYDKLQKAGHASQSKIAKQKRIDSPENYQKEFRRNWTEEQKKEFRSQKAKEAVLKTKQKYGEDFFSKSMSDFYRRKRSESLENCIKYVDTNFYEILDSHFSFEDDFYLKLKCKKCGKEFLWNRKKNTASYKYSPYCDACHGDRVSHTEAQIEDFIKTLNVSYEKNSRKIISPKELDLYFPDLKIAIEVDGVWWHHDKDNSYKYEECKKQGIRLIQILDTEWSNNNEVVKQYLTNTLTDHCQKVHARKCQVRELDNITYRDFCNSNHLQGYAQAKIRLGLFYDGELVQIMSFTKPRFNKNFDFELIRLCSKSNYRIVGGAQKLFSYFKNNCKFSQLVSYCSRNKFAGGVYSQLGFRYAGSSKPNYIYVNKNAGDIKTRYACQKHVLLKKYPDLDKNMSESEMMFELGYCKIYDFGNDVFEYVKD